MGAHLNNTFHSLLIVALLLSSNVVATPRQIPDSAIDYWMHWNRKAIAQLWDPVWFFGRYGGAAPVTPTWAYGLDPNNQIMRPDHKTPGAKRCRPGLAFFKQTYLSCDATHPETDVGTEAPRFPVYFTVRRCAHNDIRIAYNLFYQKDGYIIYLAKDTGHAWDWERAVVRLSNNGEGGRWSPSHIMGSYHRDYTTLPWEDIPNTLDDAQASGSDPRQPQDVRMQSHAKIYVGSVKHSNFFTKYTTWLHTLIQYTSLAYRSDDWWYHPRSEDYIEVDSSAGLSAVFSKTSWGDAITDPVVANDQICNIPLEASKPGDKRRKARRGNIVTGDADVSLAQWGVYTNASTYEHDNGIADMNESIPVSEFEGLPVAALAQLAAMGLRQNGTTSP